MIEFLSVCWKEYSERRAKRSKREKYWKAALAYNQIHTYSIDANWMCPTCHKIHASTSMSPFTGLHYPKCCEWPEGHRYDAATGINGKECP